MIEKTTAEIIAADMIKMYETDSGIVLGIPAPCRSALEKLLEIAAQLGIDSVEDEDGGDVGSGE